jgi:hypothetical protein
MILDEEASLHPQGPHALCGAGARGSFGGRGPKEDSRVAQRLEEELSAWRGRPLELAYPYLYLDAAYFKVNWGGRVVDLALLVAVGVNEEGYRGHGRSPYIPSRATS